MPLIITRHGESLHNVGTGHEPTFAGNKVDSVLTENGRNDAVKIAEQILALHQPDIIFHSTMTRSRQTAEIIQATIEKLIGKKISLVELPGIEEMDGGDFTGKTPTEVKERYPEQAATFYANDIRNFNMPNGESYQTVVDRLQAPLETIKAQLAQQKTPIIVGHANMIKILKEHLKDDPSAKASSHTLETSSYDPEPENRAIKQYVIDVIDWEAK